MDDMFEGFGSGSAQDDLDLAALKFFAELDRQAEQAQVQAPDPGPGPGPAAEAPGKTVPPLVPDEEIMEYVADSGGPDSLILSLMSDPEPAPRRPQPRPGSYGRLTRPVPKKKREAGAPPPGPSATAAPLSDLAQKAAQLFDSLPTEDQLLAYTLLQKLAKAVEQDRERRTP